MAMHRAKFLIKMSSRTNMIISLKSIEGELYIQFIGIDFKTKLTIILNVYECLVKIDFLKN